MIGAVRKRIDHFFGRGAASIAVPVMDGALKANEALDALTPVFALAGVDNLTAGEGEVWASSGPVLMRCESGTPQPVARFDSDISAIALSPGGRLAIGLGSGQVQILAAPGESPQVEIAVPCPTALLFLAEDRLAIASGSAENPPDRWQRDLMTGGASGSLLLWTPGETRTLCGGLAWPYGLVAGSDGLLIVSESWAHRLLRIDPEWGTQQPTSLSRLPGYPARIVPASGGGYWLCLFAPRNQLVEFTLTETEYRDRMIATIAEPFWIAPALRFGHDFREALQGGGVKQMGVLKPWAPSLSYGLVVRLDPDLKPTGSLHSRANGNAHGVTSLAVSRGNLWIGAKGDGVVLSLPEAEA